MKKPILLFTALMLTLMFLEAPQTSIVGLQSSPTATEYVLARDNLRGVRYCEILIINGPITKLTGTVYNTAGLNDCPADQWKALNPDAIKKQTKALAVVMNGPRYFLMDRTALKNPGAV